MIDANLSDPTPHHRVWILALAVLTALALRLPDTSQGWTVDEQSWLYRTQQFNQQLGLDKPGLMFADKGLRHYPGGPVNIQSHHPGYLTVLLHAPLAVWLLPDHPTIHDIIRLRWVQTLAVILTVIALWAATRQRLDTLSQSALLLFIATEPYLVGESRQLKQDAILTLGVTLTALAVLGWIRRPRAWWPMLIGVCCGLLFTLKAVSLLMLAWIVIFGTVRLLRIPRERPSRALLHFGVGGSVGFLIAAITCSPNVWHDPLRGLVGVLQTSLRSPQANVSMSAGSDLVAFAGIFLHLSPLFIVLLTAALLILLTRCKQLTAEQAFLIGTGAVWLLAAGLSGVKSPRYVLPAVPLLALLVAVYIQRVPQPSRRVLLWGFVALTALLHTHAFLVWRPYPMLYTWPGATPLSTTRLTSSVLAPQIAEDLRQRGLDDILVITGGDGLRWYLPEAHIRDAYEPSSDASAVLFSRKYYHRVPDDWIPVTSYSINGQTIYWLYTP